MDVKSKNIQKFLFFVNKKKCPAEQIVSNRFLNDEPKIYSYTAILKKTNRLLKKGIANGYSFLKKEALLKCLGESLERYCLGVCPKKFVKDSYNDLKEKAVNPKDFCFFSKKDFQLKPKFRIDFNRRTKFNWVKGYSLIYKKRVFIPAQLVFVPYYYNKKEPRIRIPITTGAACYSSFKGAILRGLLEVIERDAFMISYLNKLQRKIVDISKSRDKVFKKITAIFKKYNLELSIIDISTDIPVYSILAIVIDKTNLGPAVSLGLKSGLNIKRVIIGAVEESLQGRFWLREEMIKQRFKKTEKIFKALKRRKLINPIERGIFWSKTKIINKIDFFIKAKKISFEKYPFKKIKKVDSLFYWFKKENIDVLYVDITLPKIKRKNIYIVKVIVPTLQPLYLDERFPYWRGERLKSVPLKLGYKPLREINKFPHPFL